MRSPYSCSPGFPWPVASATDAMDWHVSASGKGYTESSSTDVASLVYTYPLLKGISCIYVLYYTYPLIDPISLHRASPST